MEIEITPEREKYFSARGKIVLNACPGSGKTTCIVKKLSQLEKECRSRFGSYSGIACLSFTNVAKKEILQKYKLFYGHDLNFPHTVLTIDSFINQYITLPFYNLIYKDSNRPRIVDDSGVFERLIAVKYLYNGKMVNSIPLPMSSFKNKKGLALFRSYPPNEIWKSLNGDYTFCGKIPDPFFVSPEEFKKYGESIFKWKTKKGIISSLDSSNIALEILNNFSRIGQWLVERFPYLVVDEAQDSSEIQNGIFDKLIECGLKNIELVGDPYQSLYEWRDAKPELFIEKYNDPNWLGLSLNHNRRSVQRIIDCFSIIRNSEENKIVAHGVNDLKIPIIIYRYNEGNHSSVIQHFEELCIENKFLKNHIVVRGNTLKRKLIGGSSDVYPWKELVPLSIIKIKLLYNENAIKECIDRLREVLINFIYSESDFHEKQNILNELKLDYIFNSKLYNLLSVLPDISESIEMWTFNCIKVFQDHFELNVSESFTFKVKINGYKMSQLKNEPLSNYFKKSSSSKQNLPITTIHQVKGATLDAILCFFDEKSTGESVSISDFRESIAFPTEKQRMIYVACSRPSQLLALAVPLKIKVEDLESKFGSQIRIIDL